MRGNIKTIKQNKKLFGRFATVYSLLAGPVTAFAANPTIQEYKGADLSSFLVMIRDYLLGFAGSLAVLFVIIGGIMYMTAAGNEKRVGVAKQTLTYAIGGLVIVLLSWVILTFVVNVFIGSIFTG